METGTVKRFNKIKGYGFITPDTTDDKEKEVFVHFSEVQSSGYKELVEGQKISYELKSGDRGEYAANVAILEN